MQPQCILVILVILDHSLIFRVIIPEVVFIQLFSWGWAHSCLKHVEDLNKCIIEEKWRARFGRGFGPVVRQTTKWMRRKCVSGWLPTRIIWRCMVQKILFDVSSLPNNVSCNVFLWSEWVTLYEVLWISTCTCPLFCCCACWRQRTRMMPVILTVTSVQHLLTQSE